MKFLLLFQCGLHGISRIFTVFVRFCPRFSSQVAVIPPWSRIDGALFQQELINPRITTARSGTRIAGFAARMATPEPQGCGHHSCAYWYDIRLPSCLSLDCVIAVK